MSLHPYRGERDVTTVTFDTLEFTEHLIAGGVPESQAKAHARALAKVAEEQLITREHFDARMERLESKLLELEYRMTIKLGGMMMVAVGVMAALVKLL